MEVCPECKERRKEMEEELVKKMQRVCLETDVTTEEHGEFNVTEDGGEAAADEVEDVEELQNKAEADLDAETETFDSQAKFCDTEQETDLMEEIVVEDGGEEAPLALNEEIVADEKEAIPAEADQESESEEKTVDDNTKTEESDSDEGSTAAALTKYICDLDDVQF